MISDFIITFRETLEAALIVGIILSYLVKTRKEKYNNIVYLGVSFAVIASIIGAYLFNLLAGGFEGTAEQLFEGITMLIGAFLLTFMIIWMLEQKHIAAELHKKVDKEIDEKHRAGLFSLVFISVFREGIETVIFLRAAASLENGTSIFGALSGILAAVVLGYIIFVVGKRVNLKLFFNATSVMLILFAAGLTAHSIHEFEEAGVLPSIIEHVWDINPPVNADGTYPLLHERGAIGSIAVGLFGYNGNPSLLEVISYIAYILIVAILIRTKRFKEKDPSS